jgi:hypothetical protein
MVIWDLQNGKQGINPQIPTYGTRDCKSTPCKIYDISKVDGMAFVWLLSSASITDTHPDTTPSQHGLP